MDYSEDYSGVDGTGSIFLNEDALRVMVMIVTILMVVIGIPSFFSGFYDDPLPVIVMLGFLAVIFSIFYLASKLEQMTVVY